MLASRSLQSRDPQTFLLCFYCRDWCSVAPNLVRFIPTFCLSFSIRGLWDLFMSPQTCWWRKRSQKPWILHMVKRVGAFDDKPRPCASGMKEIVFAVGKPCFSWDVTRAALFISHEDTESLCLCSPWLTQRSVLSGVLICFLFRQSSGSSCSRVSLIWSDLLAGN